MCGCGFCCLHSCRHCWCKRCQCFLEAVTNGKNSNILTLLKTFATISSLKCLASFIENCIRHQKTLDEIPLVNVKMTMLKEQYNFKEICRILPFEKLLIKCFLPTGHSSNPKRLSKFRQKVYPKNRHRRQS